MRVLILGKGGIARRVARDLSEHPDVSRVDVIEDGAPRIDGADVAVGCLGPDPDLEVAAADAAIGAGVPYICVCDDLDSYEAIGSLDEKARQLGSLVVLGLGWTPGITNVLAKAGGSEMEEVSSVRIAWVTSTAGELGTEGLLRAMRSLSGHATIFEDGAWHRAPAGSAGEQVYFPEPVGWRRVHLSVAPEVLTLPKTLPVLGHVTVKGGVTEGAVDRIARRLSEMSALAAPSRRERLIASVRPILPWVGRLSGHRHTWSAARVDVRGVAEAEPRVATFGVLDQFANLAAASLVVGALLVARGSIKGAGVLPPETVVDPSEFFAALADRGVRVARLER